MGQLRCIRPLTHFPCVCDSRPLCAGTTDQHTAHWTWARKDRNGRTFPQAIAHRGYKAAHPENTLKAFQGAVEVGAHAIETDIHLTKDHVVVLSHDGDLKRCFGRKEKIIDCNWDFISQLRTIKAPHEPMPRLVELLRYVAQPGLEDIWILLDIKMDNDADDVMRLIQRTIDSVPANPSRSWEDRIVLGVWAVKFLPLCQAYLPGFPISHIGFSTCYARQFLKVENCSFNMLQKVLLGPIGANFMKDVRKAGRQLFVWTVNDENLMKWSIQRRVDGVITDDPKKFKEVCDNYGDNEPPANVSLFQWMSVPYSYCFHSYRWYRRVVLTNPLRYTFWSVSPSDPVIPSPLLLIFLRLYMLIGTFWFMFNRRFPETVEKWLKTKQAKKQATLKLGA